LRFVGGWASATAGGCWATGRGFCRGVFRVLKQGGLNPYENFKQNSYF